MNVLILILALGLLTPVPQTTLPGRKSKTGQFDFNSQIGVASIGSSNQLCLDIKNPNLIVGDRVEIILLNQPQSTAQAKVVEKVEKTCSERDLNDERESHYALQLSKGKVDASTPAIAVVKSEAPLVIDKQIVSADLDRDGQREHFKVCASSEGLHLTVWSGRPISGKRRWHRYYYLGYDLEGDCTNKETEEP